VRKSAGDKVLLKRRSSEGRPFDVEKPTTMNVRFCLGECTTPKGTRRRPCWNKWSDQELITIRREQQSSRRWTGASIIQCKAFIHSFDLYSTSSRKLLGGAPDSCRVKKNSFKLIIECA